MIDSMIDLLIDRSIDLLIDCLNDWLISHLIIRANDSRRLQWLEPWLLCRIVCHGRVTLPFLDAIESILPAINSLLPGMELK